MATAHLIYGYIGAGKTTYARMLERELPAVRFSTDEWIAQLYAEDEAEIADFDACVRRVEAAMRPIWCQCMELGVDVVLDLGFWARAKRDEARRLVTSCGGTSRLYYLRCADDVAWRRVERRNDDPRGSIRMARNTFDVLKANLEPLGSDEEHVVVET